MFIERTIACASALLLSTLLAGCSGSDQPGGEQPGAEWTESTAARAAPLSYEEYREKARKTVDGRELFIVEGDMIFDKEESLRSYYDQLYLSPQEKSVIKLVNGAQAALRAGDTKRALELLSEQAARFPSHTEKW